MSGPGSLGGAGRVEEPVGRRWRARLAGSALPIDGVLDEVLAAVADHGRLVLQAPPGAGKTTRVPLALLDVVDTGRIVVLEPRRVAARAAAQRLAEQLGEPVGRTVGVTTRDDRRTSSETRVEIVTDGIVLRRLQRDPALEGTALLLFDEFHERALDADLALAFALESAAALRDDLRLVVASATLEGDRLAELLGGAPVVRAEGRSHPVHIEYREPADRRRLTDAVVAVTLDEVERGAGDVLVFLPGAREIRRVARGLRERGLGVSDDDAVVLPLFGSLPGAQQDAAIRPRRDGRRKVVLATDLAESSLTIDGVRVVVDAGRSREPRFDPSTGMAGLVTVAASRASADQRAGRAGRTAPGRAVRLWAEREHAARDAQPRPAIATDDLTQAALQVAAWGADLGELALLDPPDPSAWARASATLRELGALGEDDTITAHGRALVELPVHPRLAHLLVRGRERGLGQLATELAAVLTDRDPLADGPDAPCSDLAVRVAALRGRRPPAGVRVRDAAMRRARREQRRLARLLGVHTPDAGASRRAGAPTRTDADDDLDAIGGLVLEAWPDRLAGRRTGARGRFLLASGRGATLPEGDVLAGEDLLAVAHLDRGDEQARIHLAAAVDLAEVHTHLGRHVATVEEVAWRDGEVVAERRESIGAVVLARRDGDPDPDALLAALLDGLAQDGIELLDVRDEDRTLQARVALMHDLEPDAWPDLSDERLLRDAEVLIAPFLLTARRRRDLARIRLHDVLQAQLSAPQRRRLDEAAPTHLRVPSGSSIRLDYAAGPGPVLAVRLQELFGARTTPSIADGRIRVLVHLLSPAQRPVQVTDDLAGFWARTYPQVRAELRGRYPKHAWPEDPIAATPVRGTGRRRRRD